MAGSGKKPAEKDSRVRGRQPNILETVRITISTTPQVVALLERLVQTGLYGKSQSEAAERLLSDALIKMLREGELPVEEDR